jgi:hypothetical protein
MVAAEESKQRDDLESQVWNALSAFEQLVQAVPNDRVALDALAQGFEQVGDLTRSREYLVRLARVVLDADDHEGAAALRERLQRHAGTDPAIRDVAARIEHLLAQGAGGEGREGQAAAETVAAEAESPAAIVPAEMTFAWMLLQAGELTEDDYANAVSDLVATTGAKTAVTVSLLHVLHDRAFRHLERVVANTARDVRMAVIPISAFELAELTVNRLSLDMMIRSGAMIFDNLGADALVAILNPYNKTLQKRVEALAGRKCHFFLTTPAEFDAAIEKVKARLGKPAEG